MNSNCCHPLTPGVKLKELTSSDEVLFHWLHRMLVTTVCEKFRPTLLIVCVVCSGRPLKDKKMPMECGVWAGGQTQQEGEVWGATSLQSWGWEELLWGGFHCTHLSGKMKTNLVSCSDLFHSHRSGPVRSGPVRSSRMLDLYWTSFLTDSGHRSVFHPRRPWLERFCTTTGRCDAPVCPPLGLQTSTWGQPPHH